MTPQNPNRTPSEAPGAGGDPRPTVETGPAGTSTRRTAESLMAVREVAALLNVPLTWVYERTRKRGRETIPHVKLGKYVRFDRADIESYMEKQRRG